MSRRPGARSAASPRRSAAMTAQPSSRALGALGTRPLRHGAAALAAVALLSVPALAACGSGNDALTNLARTTTNTAEGAVGSINLRNVYVAGPVSQGGDAQVISAFSNVGTEPDQLVSISSPDASGGQPGTPAAIPAAGLQVYIANGSAPTLTGFKKALSVGTATKITFTFAKSGSVTLDVPVEPPAPGASAAATSTSLATATTSAPAATTTTATTGTQVPTTGATAATTVTATPTS